MSTLITVVTTIAAIWLLFLAAFIALVLAINWRLWWCQLFHRAHHEARIGKQSSWNYIECRRCGMVFGTRLHEN